ncbi:MAG: hypothetical protein JO111_03130 [Caulobacteraceae bacterium]|nr:hypothetical protein [Caulobacteraceae bacterium]
MRAFIVALVLAFAIGGAADAKSCKDPNTGHWVKCSPSAVAPGGNPTPAVAAPTASAPGPATASSGGGPQCKTGKPCGGGCIAKNKVCHKG